MFGSSIAFGHKRNLRNTHFPTNVFMDNIFSFSSQNTCIHRLRNRIVLDKVARLSPTASHSCALHRYRLSCEWSREAEKSIPRKVLEKKALFEKIYNFAKNQYFSMRFYLNHIYSMRKLDFWSFRGCLSGFGDRYRPSKWYS